MPPVSVCHQVSTMGHRSPPMCVPVPDPCLGVDGLAHRPEEPQARQVVGGGEVLAPLHEGADRRRRRIEDVHLVPLDDLPPAVAGRRVRRSLVHDRGGGVRQRSVDDVAVPGHPADVGRRPEDVRLRLEVEDEAVRGRDVSEVAATGVEDALRLRRRPAGVHDVERVLGVERLGSVRLGLARHQVVPPHVARLVPRHVLPGPADHQHALDVGTLLDRLVDRGLEGARRAAAVPAVGRDDEVGVAVEDPAPQCIGREAAEDHRVGCPQAGAGQHGDHRLGDHRHVDGHLVTRLHAQLDQRHWQPGTPWSGDRRT